MEFKPKQTHNEKSLIMAEKIVDKVIAKGIVKRKSEDEGDLEIKQNFVLGDIEELYREKISEVIFQELEVKEGYEFERVLSRWD